MQFTHSDPLLEDNRLQNSCKLLQSTSPSTFNLLILMAPMLLLSYLRDLTKDRAYLSSVSSKKYTFIADVL